MDKEKLKKHHFWILLGLALILIPVVLSGVWMSVAQATMEQTNKVESEKKKLADQSIKGTIYLTKQEEHKNFLESRKDVVWKEVYDAQVGLIEWPKSLSYLDKLYFGDPISDEDRNAFRKGELYLPEYESLAELVKPTELSGGWEKLFSYVKWGERRPSSEDCWLALEDLCIQREMMRCVHAVNQLMSQFVKVETPEAEKELKELYNPAADEMASRWVSPYWQLDIVLKKSADGKAEFLARGALRNVSHRRLNVAKVDFMLSLFNPAENKEGRPGILSVEGDFLEVYSADNKAEIKFKDRKVVAGASKPMIYAVEQKLEKRDVPVKRIDRIALGYHSHRTADKPLVMCSMSEEEKKKQGGDAPPPDPANPPPPAAPGAAAPATDRTPSGIARSRYITTTKQVRRMPIGVVLIVDQAHVQDVLRAFANSRLRFQTTQVHESRYRGSLSSATAGPSVAPPPSGPATAMPNVPPRGERTPQFPGVPGVMPPPMAFHPGMGTGEETNTNLVEMAVYGLASIYEKFPPKSTEPTAAPTPDPAAKGN